MKAEDRLKNIISESVRNALNENLKCSDSDIRRIYMTMCEWQKLDSDIEGFEDFKVALDNAIDKLTDVLWLVQFKRPRPSSLR